MSTLINDIKFSFRQLVQHPFVTGIAVVTLALGMAGNTMIFSLVNAFFLRPMPFHEPGRLVDLDETAPKWNLQYTGLAYPDFYSWREQNQTFESMAAWTRSSFILSVKGNAKRVQGARVTHDMLSLFGLRPALGRTFTPEEDRPGGDKVAMISAALAQQLFGTEAVLGEVLYLTVNREPYTIVGVLPSDKTLLEDAKFWIPLAEDPENLQKGYFLRGFGRLKPSVTMAMASQDLMRVHRGLVEAHRANENTSPKLTNIAEREFGGARPVLTILMGAVAVVLLIACGNVVALMLARGLARKQELGIRMSLGATAGRVTRLIATESLLVSGVAGLLGLALGHWGLHTLLNSLTDRPPQWLNFSFDYRIYLFGLGMVLLTAAFGILPTWHVAIVRNILESLAPSSRQNTMAPTKRRSLNVLVAAEVALTLVLLTQAALLVQAFQFLQKMDPGYRVDDILVYRIALPESQYKAQETWQAFYADHLEQVRALPGVQAASAITAPPLGGHWGSFFNIENAPAPSKDEPDPAILQRMTWPGYFETMGIPLVAGRTFTEQDGRTKGSQAVIVNETFAKRFWPDQDPIGKRISHRHKNALWMTVVGVAKDVKHYSLDQPQLPGVYIPYIQGRQNSMAMVVRTADDPLSMVSTVRDLIHRHDPDLPMLDIQTMAGSLHQSLWLRRFYSSLIGIFAAVALIMAVGGLYGVFSYVVSGRTREIGVRIALGAHRQTVLWLILRQGLILTAIGTGIGLVGVVISVNLMRSLLVGIGSQSWLSFLAVPFVLIIVALLACLIPARRATRIDPMEALHYE